MSDTIHHKWIKYLEANTHLLAGRTADSVIDFTEKELPRFIREHFRKNFNAIYDITDASFYQRILDEYYLNAKAKEDDEKQQRKFTQAVKLYMSFLRSKTFRGRVNKAVLTDTEKRAERQPANPVATKPKDTPDPMMPEGDDDGTLVEGRIYQVHVTRHERNRQVRQLCLQHYGYVCQVCGIDLEKVYGEPGKQFIEVHHLNPIADTDGEYVLDPVNRLVPLCSNCHSMIHRKPGGQPYTLQELRNLYKAPTWDKIEEKMKG